MRGVWNARHADASGRCRRFAGQAGCRPRLLLALVAVHAALGAPAPARWIVFAAHPNGLGSQQLFRIQTNGQGLKQITTGKLLATAPAFAPNGKRLAFQRLGLRDLRREPRRHRPAQAHLRQSRQLPRLLAGRQEDRVPPVRSSTSGGSSSWPRPGALRVGCRRRRPRAGRRGPRTARGSSSPAGVLVRIDARTGKLLKHYGLPLDLGTTHTATVSPAPDGRVPRPAPHHAELRRRLVPALRALSRQPPRSATPSRGPRHRPRRLVPDGTPRVRAPRGARVLAGRRDADDDQDGRQPAGDAPPAWQPR